MTDQARPSPARAARAALAAAALALCSPIPASGWQALPYLLHQGLAPGDLHMGVRLLGALQLPRTRVDGVELVELSGLAYDEDAGILYLLSDQGALFHARVDAGDKGLLGIDLLSAHVLRDASGKRLTGRAADAEGLSLIDGRNGRADDARLLVSFERDARVAEYRPDGHLLRDLGLPKELDRRRFASINRGPEAVASRAEGGFYVAAERPLRGDPPDRVTLFGDDGRRWHYRLANDNSALVAMEMLDGGEMLVLERDFDRFLYRLVTRLRLASGFDREGDELVVRDVADFDNNEGWRVDNFEGLTRLTGNRFLTVSDDNASVLQRTLLLLFELEPGRDAQSPKYEPVQEAER